MELVVGVATAVIVVVGIIAGLSILADRSAGSGPS
jgi:hypothetical protein